MKWLTATMKTEDEYFIITYKKTFAMKAISNNIIFLLAVMFIGVLFFTVVNSINYALKFVL